MKPTRRNRAIVAALIGAYGAAWVLRAFSEDPSRLSDFDQVYYAATAIRHGFDPYAVIGPHGTWLDSAYPLYYPMPAVLLAWPLSFLPVLLARCVFVGGSSALLAYGATRRAWFPLIAFTSISFTSAATLAQWSPLLAASLVLPLVAIAWPAKPNIGLICGAAVLPVGRRTLTIIAAAWVALLVTSFAVTPTWLRGWIDAVRHAPHIRPIAALPGGVLLLLGLLRWRRPEGRLLAAFAIVPATPMTYDALPVMLIGESRREALFLSLCSAAAFGAQLADAYIAGRNGDMKVIFPRLGTACVWFIYLPALVMVLRRPHR